MIIKDQPLHDRLSQQVSLVISENGEVSVVRALDDHAMGTIVYPLFQCDPEQPRFTGLAYFPTAAAAAAQHYAHSMPGSAQLTLPGGEVLVGWSENAELDAFTLSLAPSADPNTWQTAVYAVGGDFGPVVAL